PYDAPARGKMERFWGTMRGQCLTFCEGLTSLHDLNVRLIAWVDEQYHVTPHGGLMGKTPAEVMAAAPDRADTLDEAKLDEALTVRERRRVRRDNTLAVGGVDWETSLHFLAGSVVTVARSFLDPDLAPWIEHEGKRHGLSIVDPVHNARLPRTKLPAREAHERRVDFDPPGALVARMLGRTTRDDGREEAGQ
ncbi:transposase, partial [Candidatus Woesearchaeota archaeon]|nr:transposase [Candidatus Woesearchaeota archaeon]